MYWIYKAVGSSFPILMELCSPQFYVLNDVSRCILYILKIKYNGCSNYCWKLLRLFVHFCCSVFSWFKSWEHLSIAGNESFWQLKSHNSSKEKERIWGWGAWLTRHLQLGLHWVSCSAVLQKLNLHENCQGSILSSLSSVSLERARKQSFCLFFEFYEVFFWHRRGKWPRE